MKKSNTLKKFKTVFNIQDQELKACGGRQIEFVDNFDSGVNLLKHLGVNEWMPVNDDGEEGEHLRVTLLSQARKMGFKMSAIKHPECPAFLLGRIS